MFPPPRNAVLDRYNHTQTWELYKNWSDASISLLGGNGSSYGVLGFNNTLNPTQYAEWVERSVRVHECMCVLQF